MKQKKKKIQSLALGLMAWVGLLFLNIFGEMQFQKPEDIRSAFRHYDKGKTHVWEGNLEKAENEFNKSLEKMPEHAYSSYYLASLYYMKDDLPKALSEIRKAVANLETVAEWQLQAQAEDYKALFKRSRGQEDIMELQETCTLTARAQRELEWTQEQIDDVGKIIESFDKQLQEIKSNYVFLYGTLLLKAKDYQKAFEKYQEALRLNPKNGEVYNNLTNLFFAGKDYPSSLSYIQKAEQLGVGHYINLELKKRVFEALDRPVTGIMEKEFPGGVMQFILRIDNNPFTNRPSYENAYLVFDEESKDAVLIDPGKQDERIEAFVHSRKLKVASILNTHGHSDHIGGNDYYADLFGAEVMAHVKEKNTYADNGKVNMPDRFFKEENQLKIGTIDVTVIPIPGHSSGSVGFLINGMLFSGDSLAKESIGNVWGETRQERQKKLSDLVKRIQVRFLSLPAETRVFPGHGEATSVEWEKKHNIFLH